MARTRSGPIPTRWRTARARVLTVVVLGLVAACAPGDADPVTESAISPRRPGSATGAASVPPVDGSGFPDDWRPAPLEWQDCDLPRGGRCATLEVPLDWDAPDGTTIDLALGRIPADGVAIGPLLVNPGGPGGSGLDFLAADPVSPDLAERFDLVSWDPRGVGGSADLSCGAAVDPLLSLDPTPDDAAEQERLEDAAAALADECAESDGEVLAHLGTADVARDVEAIRRALDEARISYLGFSYGTHIGQQYAQQFPTRVRAMVLDGVVDPALGYEAFLIEQALAFEAAFDRGVAACRDAGPSRCGVEDLAAAYDRIAAQVETAPLAGGDRPVGPAELATAAVQTSYGTDGWQVMGPALAAALDGDGGPLWDLAAGYYDFGDFTSYAAVVCIDAPPPQGADAYRAFADEARRLAPRLGGAVANELASCATWSAAPTGAAAPITAAGAPPILVVGNTGDAATPYANAAAVSSALADAVLLTVEIDGHTAYGANHCATRVIDAYLVALTLPGAGMVCPG